LTRPRDFWQPARSPGAAALWGLSGNQDSSSRLPRGERSSPLLREKGEHQQLFLAVPRSSNRAKGEEEDFTAHTPTQGHVPAPGGLSIQKGFLLVAS